MILQENYELMQQYNDQDQYPTFETFETIIQEYLLNLSLKKRDKALIDQARYNMILQVLKDPRNTAVSTAQFRFWVKKMFQLSPRQLVCHDGKPVAMKEQIYQILVKAHREAHHGGRDKTSALVRTRYSWIPKELIARFVRHCPFCISRRNGNNSITTTTITTHNNSSNNVFLPSNYPMNDKKLVTSEEMMMMAAASADWQPTTYYPSKETFVFNTMDVFELDTNMRNMISMSSPALSPSSSSTSATSSPVHPIYLDNNIRQLSLLSHHQSLY